MVSFYLGICCVLLLHLEVIEVQTAATVDEVSRSNCEFAFDLHRQIALSAGSRKNAVFSPLSAAAALSMVHLGARYKTLEELDTVLHYAGLEDVHLAYKQLLAALEDPTNNYTLEVASGAFASNRYLLNEDYVDVLARFYGAPLRRLDFVDGLRNATDTVNAWVLEETRGMVPGFFHRGGGALTANVVLLLLNAVFFRGRWKFDFDPAETRPGQFRLDEHTMQEMDFMQQKRRLHYWPSSGGEQLLPARVLELPFAGDEVRLYIVLPDAVLGLYQIERSLTYELLSRAMSRDRRRGALLTVHLPKFTLDVRVNMRDVLFKMGVRDLFFDRADLRGIGPNLYVTDVLQRAIMEVSEEGVTAVAVSGIQVMLAGPTPDTDFRIDRPFLFFLKEHATGNILFMGRLVRSPTPGTEIGEFDPDLLGDSSSSVTASLPVLHVSLLFSILSSREHLQPVR